MSINKKEFLESCALNPHALFCSFEVQQDEIKEKVFKITDCDFTWNLISPDDANQVVEWIKLENKKNEHMLEPMPEEILKTEHFITAKVNELLIGYTRLTPIGYKNIQEIWSSIVHEWYRKKQVGINMMKDLIENSKQDPVYGITNVSHVEHMFQELDLIYVAVKDISGDVFEKIEELWALLPDDVVYANNTFMELFTNQK